MTGERVVRRLAAILAADVVGYRIDCTMDVLTRQFGIASVTDVRALQ